jgi:two-component system, OmpR family, phosphate regulon sensor histidine kinase PhoR
MIIAMCTDVTMIKQLESASQKLRAMFFSSVAHELRTPLNSIIPVVKMIIDYFSANFDTKVKNYLKVILNSAYHLQNVIEDALDMSRIENNKFSIFKEMFDIKGSVNEVCDIMRF